MRLKKAINFSKRYIQCKNKNKIKTNLGAILHYFEFDTDIHPENEFYCFMFLWAKMELQNWRLIGANESHDPGVIPWGGGWNAIPWGVDCTCSDW